MKVKLTTIKLANFRSFSKEVVINIEDFTTLIGKNDAGKSTILEALEIFFNSEIVKPELDDLCKFTIGNKFFITCCFNDLPSNIIIDDSVATSFDREYLLNNKRELEIIKEYTCTATRITSKVYLNTVVPDIQEFFELVTFNNISLKAIAKKLDIDEKLFNKSSNVSLRDAIRTYLLDANPGAGNTEYFLEISGSRNNIKEINSKIQKMLPHYALFQADRPSKDDDNEVQNPLRLAIKSAIDQVTDQLEEIKDKVQSEVMDLANHTLQKLAEMDPELARQLVPQPKKEPEWHKIFNFTLDGDNEIPINKRGSGVRRLILLNFFRAQAERNSQEKNIILAVEEPETAQHPNNQQKLVETLMALSEEQNYQVLITTHVPAIAEMVPLDSIRYLNKSSKESGFITVSNDDIYLKIADELGILPDKRVGVFVCVEGKNDVMFLKHLSRILYSQNEIDINLHQDSRVVILPVGGCKSLKQFVCSHYLEQFNLPYVHILDRDDNDAQHRDFQTIRRELAALNNDSELFITARREMENYLCPKLIKDYVYQKYKIPSEISFDFTIEPDTDVPKAIRTFLIEQQHLLGKMDPPKEDKIKGWLNDTIAAKMTVEKLHELNAYSEIVGWFKKMEELCNGLNKSVN
ncbi:TPA: ATP-binding protein [Bacillus cereus]|nr:ATP-binding protein [Bacillus cereus]HDR3910834.1 ATP-binding protein [Bacillus cereus]HDR3914925.1 ATP-binding protein [Bacillus cereus]HDV7169658.1 ATP-binding protein [Bacillus cereus]